MVMEIPLDAINNLSSISSWFFSNHIIGLVLTEDLNRIRM